MQKVDTILFDLDDTLIEYENPLANLLERTYEEIGISPVFSIDEYNKRYDDNLERSSDMYDLCTRCFVAAAEEHGYEAELGREIAKTYSKLRDQTAVRFRAGAVTALDHLSIRIRLRG
jgi:FMN phosphatase YigB (HAD superfamily)